MGSRETVRTVLYVSEKPFLSDEVSPALCGVEAALCDHLFRYEVILHRRVTHEGCGQGVIDVALHAAVKGETKITPVSQQETSLS